MTFLPDMNGVVQTADGEGMVLAGTPESLLRAAGRAFRAPLTGGPDVEAVRFTTRKRLASGERDAWRGAIAAALLLDTWADAGIEISLKTVTPEDSALAAAVLSAAGRSSLELVMLTGDRRTEALGLTDADLGLVPAAGMADLSRLLPDRLFWYNRSEHRFEAPGAALNQRDRQTLAARLRLLGGEELLKYAEELEAIDSGIVRAALHGDEAAAWKQRVLSAATLQNEKDITGFSVITERYRPVSVNPLLAARGLQEPLRAWQAQTVCRWRQVPFARSNAEIGLEGPGIDGASLALGEAAGEASFLLTYSERCLRALPERLAVFVERCGGGLSAEAKEALRSWEDQARIQANQPVPLLEMTWPWRTDSEALRLMLRETLGGALADALMTPFTERLMIVDGGDLGSDEQNVTAALMIHGFACVAVPPLSDRLTEALARLLSSGEDVPMMLRYMLGEEDLITADLVLGGGRVCLRRAYPLTAQYRPETVPQVALWPAVPLPRDRWSSYWLSVTGEAEISALNDGKWQTLSCPEEGRRVLRTDTSPCCVSLRVRGEALGALFHLAPVFSPERLGTALAAIDAGMSGIALGLRISGHEELLTLPSLWHVLLRGAKPVDMSREPLPVWPMGPVLPMMAELSTDAGMPLPFEDGRLLPAEAGIDEGTRPGLTWRTDADGQAARLLMLREVMTLLSFHGVMCGAERIAWRVALPSGLSDEAADLFRKDVQRAADATARDCGLACDGRPAFVRTALADALALRRTGEAVGAFGLIDMGSASACAALWLRGMDRPALESDLAGGVFHMLTAALTNFPWIIDSDFGGDPLLPVTDWSASLYGTGSELRKWEKRWLLVEDMLGARLQETMTAVNRRNYAGQMTYTQALLLLGSALRLFEVSLMIGQVGDDPLLNDQLPQELDVLLCGRGLLPLAMTDEPLRSQTLAFLSAALRPDHPVRRVMPRFSRQPKLETVTGLMAAGRVDGLEPLNGGFDAEDAVMTAEGFLFLFLRQLPQAALLLFPAMFTNMGFLMPEADLILRRETTGDAPLPDRMAQGVEALMIYAPRRLVQPSGAWGFDPGGN